jgi:hypothetical protein
MFSFLYFVWLETVAAADPQNKFLDIFFHRNYNTIILSYNIIIILFNVCVCACFLKFQIGNLFVFRLFFIPKLLKNQIVNSFVV